MSADYHDQISFKIMVRRHDIENWGAKIGNEFMKSLSLQNRTGNFTGRTELLQGLKQYKQDRI